VIWYRDFRISVKKTLPREPLSFVALDFLSPHSLSNAKVFISMPLGLLAEEKSSKQRWADYKEGLDLSNSYQ